MALFGERAARVLRDRSGRRSTNVRDALTDWAPPLSGVVDEILAGLATASPSLSIIGLVGSIWGATRLFASLETGIGAMFAEAPRRGIVARTTAAGRVGRGRCRCHRRWPSWRPRSPRSSRSSADRGRRRRSRLSCCALLLVLPVVLSSLALAVVYRARAAGPPGRSRRSLIPAVTIGIGLVLLTRAFAVLAPRVLGANFVYGTLGAIFVALAWLGLAYTVILIGAAWVRERMLDVGGDSAVA